MPRFFRRGVLQLLHRTPSKLDVTRAQAKTRNNNHSWTTNRAKLWMICNLLALRPILHITQKTLSYLNSTKIEQMTETMVPVIIFKNRRHFSLLHSLRSNTTTNFRPAARAYSQRYHLLLVPAQNSVVFTPWVQYKSRPCTHVPAPCPNFSVGTLNKGCIRIRRKEQNLYIAYGYFQMFYC